MHHVETLSKFSITEILCCVSQTLKVFLLWCVLWNNFQNHCACSQCEILLFFFFILFFPHAINILMHSNFNLGWSLCFCVVWNSMWQVSLFKSKLPCIEIITASKLIWDYIYKTYIVVRTNHLKSCNWYLYIVMQGLLLVFQEWFQFISWNSGS